MQDERFLKTPPPNLSKDHNQQDTQYHQPPEQHHQNVQASHP